MRRLRSTVRQLVFGPHENYLKALNYMVVAYQYSGDALNGLAPGESGTIHEPGRSMWVFSFTDHEPAVLLTYRTRDVAAEFRQSVGESVRSAFGPRSFGETLGDAIDAVDTADAVLFDSAEQAQMTTWRKGRIVLVGDSAWCTTLYAGIGVSCRFGRRRPARHDARAPSRRYPIALRHWEETLRPYIDDYQMKGRRMRSLFVQANRAEIVTEKVLKTLLNKPLTAKLLGPLKPQRGLVHRRRHRRGRADHHERPPTRTQPAGIQAMTGYPIRMGDLQTLHSELDADRISFIEFPPMAALRAFYFSDAYPPFTSNRAEDVLAFESNDRP